MPRPTKKAAPAAKRVATRAPYRAARRAAAPAPRPYIPRAPAPALAQAQSGGSGILHGLKNLAGGLLSNVADKAINWITGKGDYKVSGNTCLMGEQPAMFKDMLHGKGHRIRHREFVQDVISSTGTSISGLIVSPTNPQVFPWVSALANQYEQYRLMGCCWEYLPESGAISSSQALGYVLLASEYDSNKSLFVSKQQAANVEFSTLCVPSDKMIHPLECDPSQTSIPVLYTAPNGNPLATENLNFVNFCTTNLLVGGQSAAGVVLGSLYITYDIELLKPRPSGAINAQAELHYNMNTVTEAAPLGSAAAGLLTPVNNQSPQLLSSQVAFSGTGTICTISNVPIGTIFEVDYMIAGTTATIGSFVQSVSYGGATANALWQAAGVVQTNVFFQAPVSSTSNTNLAASWSFKATASTVVMTFAGNVVIPTAVSAADFFIRVINSN